MKKKKTYKKPQIITQPVKLGVFGNYGTTPKDGSATFIFNWGSQK